MANIVLNKYGAIDYEWGIKSASTDFVSSFVSILEHIVIALDREMLPTVRSPSLKQTDCLLKTL